MTEDQQQVLFDNTARNMGDSTLQIKHRHIYHCYQVDPRVEIDTNTKDYIEPEEEPWLL